ncbi:hypothetical protein [Cytobacillus horneckiae]|uniref:hypothetical protein n=1 Tax=Cytobacillus horneckiae TaxID=549687 RepID=UPI000B33AF3C|nr:hypothetical protein [Cytobacillus horneckiae]MEC1155022.1 hypothetical protein [Cytobacillus horneckiae]MED2936072.1 hypothetical protein [Cytobacillus horneckiae]
MEQLKFESDVELAERITEMIEGETSEVLEEIITLLNYHTGYKAGLFNGNDSFEKIISE